MFNRTRAPGMWISASVISPLEMEKIDDYYNAIDGRGGTYAPTDPIVIGGDGVTLAGALHSLTGTLTVASLAQITVADGGTVKAEGSGSADIKLYVSGGVAKLDIQNGANQRVLTGGALDIFGGFTIKASGGGEGPGTLTAETGTLSVWNSGSTLLVDSGATANLSGAVNVRGQMTFKSTANGGPGICAFETTSQCFFAVNCQVLASTNNWGWNSTSVQTHTSGSVVAGTYSSTATITQTGPYTFGSGTKPALSPAGTWHRRAKLRAVSLDSGVPQAFGAVSPLFAAPSIFSVAGSSSAVYLYLEFEPPHGGIITAVEVRSVVNSNPLATITRATYELVRWDHGLDADATSLSGVANDAHAANGSDWDSVLTTNLSSISNAQIDRTHGYGVRVTAGRLSGNALAMWYDVLITGTIAELNGQ